jgi:hypothetical protein
MSNCTTWWQRWVIVLYMCLSPTAVPKAAVRIVIDNLIVSSRAFSVVFATINKFAQRYMTARVTYCATSSWSLKPSRNSSASPPPYFHTSHFFVPTMSNLPHLLFPCLFPSVFIYLPFFFLSCRSFCIYVISFFLSFFSLVCAFNYIINFSCIFHSELPFLIFFICSGLILQVFCSLYFYQCLIATNVSSSSTVLYWTTRSVTSVEGRYRMNRN